MTIQGKIELFMNILIKDILTMPLGTCSITGLLQEMPVMCDNVRTSLTESEKLQLAISNAVKESLTDGSATLHTRDATREHITVVYLDRIPVDEHHFVTDLIALVEGGRYGGLGVVELPVASLDISELKRAHSADSDDEEPLVPGTILSVGREALTWKALFTVAAQDEPIILRRLWHITKDSSTCRAILKPLFDSAIRNGKVQIQAVLGGAGEN